MSDHRDDDASNNDTSFRIDTTLVRELAELLGQTGLSEIEVEDGARRIRVSRAATAVTTAQVVAPVAPLTIGAPGAPASTSAPEPAGDAVRSPMVGTAYLASEPGAAPFVREGDSVKAGDTLLIVEAMKVMNPITAPRAGTVHRLLIDNGQPVEFDQPLVILA